MTNIYTTPAFIEKNLRDGVKPSKLANFIGSKKIMLPDGTSFADRLTSTQSRFPQNEQALEKLLRFSAYGTSNPPVEQIPDAYEPEEQGFVADLMGDLGQIKSETKEAVGKRQSQVSEGAVAGDSFPESVLQAMGRGAQLAGDVGFSLAKGGLKALLPQAAEDRISEEGAQWLEHVATTDLGQMGLSAMGSTAEQYDEFRNAHPRLARNLEAAFGVGELASAGLITKAGGPVAKRVLKDSFDRTVNKTTKVATGLKETAEGLTPSARQAAKQQAGAVEAVIPDISARELKTRKFADIQDPSVFTKGKLTLAPSEEQLVGTANRIPGITKGQSPIKKGKMVEKHRSDLSESLATKLGDNPQIIPKSDVKNKIAERRSSVLQEFGKLTPEGELKDTAAQSAFDGVNNIWDDVVKGGKDVHGNVLDDSSLGHWRARIEFDRRFKERFGKKALSPDSSDTARKAAADVIRDSVDESIEEAAQRVGISYGDEIGEIRNLFRIDEALRTHLRTSTLESGIERTLRSKFPRVATDVAIATAVGAAVSIILNR